MRPNLYSEKSRKQSPDKLRLRQIITSIIGRKDVTYHSKEFFQLTKGQIITLQRNGNKIVMPDGTYQVYENNKLVERLYENEGN